MGNDNINVTAKVKKEPTTAPQIPANSGSRESPDEKNVLLNLFSILPSAES